MTGVSSARGRGRGGTARSRSQGNSNNKTPQTYNNKNKPKTEEERIRNNAKRYEVHEDYPLDNWLAELERQGGLALTVENQSLDFSFAAQNRQNVISVMYSNNSDHFYQDFLQRLSLETFV